MKTTTTLELTPKDINRALTEYINRQGYLLVGDLSYSISDSVSGGFDIHDGDYEPAKLNNVTCEVEK